MPVRPTRQNRRKRAETAPLGELRRHQRREIERDLAVELALAVLLPLAEG
mgnify:CR=1 FL=1